MKSKCRMQDDYEIYAYTSCILFTYCFREKYQISVNIQQRYAIDGQNVGVTLTNCQIRNAKRNDSKSIEYINKALPDRSRPRLAHRIDDEVEKAEWSGGDRAAPPPP